MLLWVLVGVGSLVGLLVVLAILGAFLPRAHVATVSARFAAAPERLWPAVLEYVAATKDPPTEIVEQEAPRRLVTKISDPKLPFGGTWTWAVEPGTTVTITEDGWISNTLFRFLARFVFGHHASARAALKKIARALGETVAPENR